MKVENFNKAVLLFLFLLFLFLPLISGCGSGGAGGTGSGGNATSPEASGTIDAGGGSLEVTNPNSPLIGLKVEIPAGTLNAQAQVSVETLSTMPAPTNQAIITKEPFNLKIHGAEITSDGTITVRYPAPRSSNQVIALGYLQNGEYIVNLANPDAGGATISTQLPIGSLNRSLDNKGALSYVVTIGQLVISRLTPGSSPAISIYKWDGFNWVLTNENWSGKVALLVHGIFSSEPQSAFESMAKFLVDPLNGFSYNNIYLVQYPTGYRIDDLGNSLSNIINSHYSNNTQLTIYAHSMGGLVARSAIEKHNCQNKAVNLVTFGTPHNGVPGSLLASLIVNYELLPGWIPEFDDLIPSSQFLDGLNQPSGTSLNYDTIAGTDGSGLATNIPTTILLGPFIPHDGLVAKSSAGLNLSRECQNFKTSDFPVNHENLIHNDSIFGQLNDWLVNSFKGKYVFSSSRNGSWDVFVVNSKAQSVDGRLIFGYTNTFDFAGGIYNGGASPSGQEMVISSRKDNQNVSELYLVDFSGNITRRLTNDSFEDYYPCFSRDGQKIVYLSQRENNRVAICEIRRDGSEQREITTLITKSDFEGPLGPDEQKLCGYIKVSYSPDGSKILFSDLLAEQYKAQFDLDIFTINVDGSGRATIYSPSGMDCYACYGENAQTIYFTIAGDRIAKLIIGSSQPTFLTASDSSSWGESYMCDGKLFFITSRDGNNNLYRMDNNGNNQVCIINSLDDDRGIRSSSYSHENTCYDAKLGSKEESIKDNKSKKED